MLGDVVRLGILRTDAMQPATRVLLKNRLLLGPPGHWFLVFVIAALGYVSLLSTAHKYAHERRLALAALCSQHISYDLLS